MGVDDNDDGSLQTSEIDQTTYICNGVDGQDGADGSASQYTMLTSISPPSASLRCNVGGRVIAQGLDNGDGGGTAQNGILEYGEVDYTTTYCSKYDIRAVTDIAPSSISSLWPGTPALQILVEDTLYFTADDGNSGIELWAHDTASSSTLLVEAIFPGSSNSNPGQYMQILVGDTIYFDADDGSSGYELWAHDTSNSTTWQVADIQNGGGHSYPGYDMKVVLVEDTIYFDADDGNSGRELWAHDTSNSTTWQVADLNSGGLGSNPGFGNTVILTDDTMFLGTWNGLYAYNTQNHSYWRLSSPSSTIRNFVSLGDVIFYYSNDGNQRLTATNTSNGTWWSIMENSCAMVGPAWYFYTVVSNILYFDHDDCTSGSEFWAYNLENDSAWQIADINPGSGSSVLWYFNGFISIGSTMYFAADGTNGVELYAHDSSNHSTWLVADINSGGGDSYPGGYAWIWKLVGDSIYFSADGGDGFELWMHTPSSGLTWQLADIRPGSQGSNPGEEVVILVGDTIYFSANDGSSGTELWAVETILTNSITYD